MPRIRFVCPDCLKLLKADTSKTGPAVRCPRCRTMVRIPGLEERTDNNPKHHDQVRAAPHGFCLFLVLVGGVGLLTGLWAYEDALKDLHQMDREIQEASVHAGTSLANFRLLSISGAAIMLCGGFGAVLGLSFTGCAKNSGLDRTAVVLAVIFAFAGTIVFRFPWF